MITLPDSRTISDGYDPAMTQDDLLILARTHHTYTNNYPQIGNLINRRLVDVNALFYEINVKINQIETLTGNGVFRPEFRNQCIAELCAIKDYVGLHPELYPTTSIAQQMYEQPED